MLNDKIQIIKKINYYFNNNDFLKLYRNIEHIRPKISHKIAKEKAETEFEKYRIIQYQLFESDFNKEIKMIFNS